MIDRIPETWYLLFDGQSPDGLGHADYVGRTLDREKAQTHADECEEDPHCTGYVIIVTDRQHARVF